MAANLELFIQTAPLFALSDSQETVVKAMLLVIVLGLIVLLIDYLHQRRRTGTEITTREVWMARENRQIFRTGLFALIACFEVICLGLLLTDTLIVEMLKAGPMLVVRAFQIVVFLVIPAILIVWLTTWLIKHLHVVRSQATLFESEQRVRLALQATNQGLYDLDLRTRESTVTPEYALLLGHDPATFRETHETWITRLHPEDRERVEKIFEDYVAGRIPDYRVECRQRTAAGEWRWILSLGKIVQRDKKSNQPIRMLGTYTDITALKQAEQQIEKQTESLRKLSAHLVESQDAERRRVARELHDTTAQQLAALGMNLSVIEQLVGDSSAKVTRLLVDSQTLVEQATQEIRTTTYLLHPPLLEAAGLAGAIQDYADGFARRSGLKIEVQALAEFERLPKDVELALFRVVQESLANVRRHSRSPTATIRLEKIAGLVRLEVLDAGIGIPEERLARMRNQTGELGVGIAGMHERLHQLGGQLDIESSAKGTVVRATWSEAQPAK